MKEQRSFITDDLKANGLVSNSPEDLSICPNLHRDIEMFESYAAEPIFEHIQNCETHGGKSVLKQILSQPIHNVDKLEQRKKILKALKTKQFSFADVADYEDDVHWFLSSSEEFSYMVYFTQWYTKGLNNCPKVLQMYNLHRIWLSPLIGILTPIVYFLVPYLVVVYTYQIPIPFPMYLKWVLGSFQVFGKGVHSVAMISYMFSLIFYFQNIFNSVEISRTLDKICRHIVDKTSNTAKYLQKAIDMLDQTDFNDIATAFSIDTKELRDFASEKSLTMAFAKCKDFSYFTSFGCPLSLYKTASRDVIKSVLYKSYVMDALCSIHHPSFSFVRYVRQTDHPLFIVERMVHPSLKKPVPNNFDLSNGKHAILTASNGAGKSVFLKSILVTQLLAQTVCMAPCKKCAITPFYYINSQINVPDSTGKESLFQAEMFRCKENLDMFKVLTPNQFCFVAMDEIFNSTNPLEGVAGAYAICKKMASYSNVSIIFSTHFGYLTRLAQESGLNFQNYKMLVEEGNKFTYKLRRGVNKLYIALELLRENGYDDDIIDEAIAIKNKLLTVAL
jgi:hypothetical protein